MSPCCPTSLNPNARRWCGNCSRSSQQQQETHPATRRRDRSASRASRPGPSIAPSPLESSAPAASRPGSEAARLRQAAQDRPIDHHRRDRRPSGRHAPGSIFKGYEDFVVQDLIISPAGHPLPPRTLADPRRPEPGGPTPRRGPARQPLRTDLICVHPPPVSPPARHPAVALGAVGPTGHRHLRRPTQPHPDRREGRLSPGEGRTPARGVGGLDLRPGGRHGGQAPRAQRLLHPHRQRVVRLLREHRQQEPPEFPGGAPRCRTPIT